VPGVDSADAIEDDRGWSIFYVALDNSGEPELRCKYRGKSSWTSESIARGVESFQVLYGIDTDADGLPNQYMNANAVEEMDKTLLLSAPNAAARKIEIYQKTNWKKVVAVQVSLLIRGVQKSRSDALSNRYELFGADYDGTSGADSGTTIKEEDIPVKERNRLRKIFLRTIILHKQSPGINA
jgi:type IV pilus assembly protein PilW